MVFPWGLFSAVWTSDCSVVLRGKDRDRFSKAPDLLCEEIVILLEQWLEHHRLYQACHVCVLSHFSRVQLCGPMVYSPPGSSVH